MFPRRSSTSAEEVGVVAVGVVREDVGVVRRRVVRERMKRMWREKGLEISIEEEAEREGVKEERWYFCSGGGENKEGFFFFSLGKLTEC